MKCSSCQSELKNGTRICNTCGEPVSLNPTLEDLYFSRLVANAPAKLVEKIRTAPYLAKERRNVTAILMTVANVEHFNQAVPENVRTQVLNKALDLFANVIYQFEGTIAKLWENTVLAFFGAPISHEDDPLRAVHAALSIQEEAESYSQEIQSMYKVPLQLNMVLNSGPVLIGDVRSNLKFEFKSLNNTLECMDLAINTAIPNSEILLIEDSYRFIKPFVVCTKLNEIYCENTDENLQLWQVDQVINQPSPMQRVPTGFATPLIGREKELDLLLELSETVLAGLGRVGLIVGDPGIGKSRLILEWKRRMKTLHQPTRIRWIEAHGLAFGRELAYHLLKDLVRAALEIPDTTNSQEFSVRLTAKLQDMIDAETESMERYLSHLLELDLPESEEDQIHKLSAKELRNHYLQSVQSLLRNLAHEQPLIIILEDLHWADASSTDLLIELLSMTTSAPILFCLVSRPDRDATGWRFVTAAREKIGPRLTELELNNLNKSESQSLVSKLVGMDNIPEIIQKTVLEKSEGNPYFIEELIRMLINEGVLVNHNSRWVISEKIDPQKIPDSLRGLLNARIDRLAPDARMTLRVASVIGRVFPERVIQQVLSKRSTGIDLLEQLSTLESLGMIKVAQIKPELNYQFQHILLQDAAYHSIFEADRSELHLIVGNTLEELYPDQKERLASQLAHHFLQGGDLERAYQYLDLAGHVAMDAFANTEAETYINRAIQITAQPERLAHLYTDLGEACAQQGKHREAIHAWNKAIEHHRKLGNTNRLARVYAWAARSAWWGYDPKRSLEICLEGLQDLQGAVESPDIAYLIHETGRAYLFNNQPEKARSYAEQALEMARWLNAFDVQAEALATIGILPTIKPEQAISALEMAVKISESHNLYGPASRAYINLAAVIDNLGEIRLARDYRQRALTLGNQAGGVSDEILINQTIANASLWLGDFEDVQKRIHQMRQINRQHEAYLDENTLNLKYLEGELARLKGDTTLAVEIFTDLIDRSRQINDHDRILQANRVLAEIILEPNLLEEESRNPSNVNLAFDIVSEQAQKVKDHTSNIPIAAYCLLSDIYASKGALAQAEDVLETASAQYRNQPAMQDRVRIILAQARLETARGNIALALEHLHHCATLLEKMEGRWWRARVWLETGILHLKRNEPEDIDQAQNLFRESLAEFKELEVNYYPDVIIEKLRQVKRVSRAQAIAHRKVTRELVEAGKVQHTFIPTHAPELPGYRISGVLLPAHETSGDFYDFIDLEDGKLGIVIADVGDKGAGAALYMAMSRTLIRTYAGESKLPPGEVLKAVNRRILSDTQRGIFLTVVLGTLDPKSNIFTYVNAGHNPPILIRQTDAMAHLIHLEKTGSLVGIFSENEWKVETLDLEEGDTLILYTDGIPEAQDESGDFFTTERLLDVLKANVTLPAEDLRNVILEEVQGFAGEAPRLDDITLVVIQKLVSNPNQDVEM